MSPRVPGGPSFSPDQVRLVVEAAGLDPSRPLDQQLGEPGSPNGGSDLESQVAALSSKLDALTDALGQANPSADPQAREQQFAENYRNALVASQSKWMGDTEPDDGA